MHHTDRKSRWAVLLLTVVGAGAIANSDVTGGIAEAPDTSVRYDLSALILPPPPGANRQEEDRFLSLTDALLNKSFSEAEVAAKHMIEQVNPDLTDAVSARARALHNLAIAQQFNGKHELAIQNYSAALDILAREDSVNPELISSLRGLAISYLDIERPDQAIVTIDRAQHVSNVNYGPHSLAQLPILNSKMQVYLDNNERGAALEVLDRIYMLGSREFAPNSEELLPILYQQAELYAEFDMRGEEYETWRRILTVKENHYAENDLALIEPNLKIAAIDSRNLRNFTYRSVTTSEAEKHLKTALRIAENSPENSWAARKDCLLSLADFYTVFGMKGRARRYYAAAWDLLSTDELQVAERTKYFGTPVPLAQPRPNPYANFEYDPNRQKSGPEDYLEGEVTIEFTVNDRGRTDDLRVVAADPPNFAPMEKRVRNAVEEFVYRPRYVDGKPTATGKQRYSARYFYLPFQYRAAVAKSDKSGRRR